MENSRPGRSDRVRFGPFEFDLRTLELMRGERHIPLPPKPSRALQLLLLRPGSLVTRDEFHRHVWPETIIEFDQGLNGCMRQLRATLGDDAAHPTFIETVPRRGYRFAETVRTVGERTRSRWRGVIKPVAVGLVLSCVAWFSFSLPRARRPIRLAILPVRMIGGAPSDTLFAEGLGEELLSAMGRLDPSRVQVMARTSAARIADEYSLERMHEELGVDFVLEARVRPEVDGYKLTARLVDTQSASAVWSGEHRSSRALPTAAQERLTAGVVEDLEPWLGGVVDADAATEPSEEVRTRWRIAQHLIATGRPSNLSHADSLLRTAIQQDSSFGPAYVALARALLNLQRYGEADVHLRRAMQLLGPTPEVLAERGRLRMRQWRLDEAGRDLARAVAGRPDDARLRHLHGYYLAVTGEEDGARREFARSQQLDPVSARAFGVGGLLASWAGGPERAVEECRDALDFALPAFKTTVHECLLHNYAALGRWVDAVGHAKEVLRAAGADVVLRDMQGAGSAWDALQRYLDWAAEDDRVVDSQDLATHYARAVARASAGDRAGALSSLRLAFASRDSRLVEMAVEARLAGLHDEAAFREIAEAIGVARTIGRE